MNYKTITVIALALCLCVFAVAPVAAEWDNGNWQADNFTEGYNTHFDAKTGVTSKYRDMNPATQPEVTDAKLYCTLTGNIRAGSTTLTKELHLTRDGVPEKTEVITISPDGKFRYEPLAVGSYHVTTFPFGNGNQLESVAVVCPVGGGEINPQSQILGAAISQGRRLYPLTIDANIDGCDNIKLNGLKLVKDELITVPESTKQVCKRVKVIDQPYVPAVPGTPEQGHWQTVVDVPAQPAVTAVTHQDYEAGHQHAKKVHGNSQHDFEYGGDKYQIVGDSREDAFIVTSHTNVRRANMVTIIDIPARPAVPAVTHQVWIVDVPAVPAVPAIQERSHYETQCHDVIVPSYQYWTYKLEGRVTVKSIDTEITNPNGIPLSGTATVIVGYTVDHNFGNLLNTNQDLENKRKTFTGRFENVQPGVNNYGDVQIVFSDRINDAIIVDNYFPQVISSEITTDIPNGYNLA